VTSFAEAFLRLRVDDKSLRTDTTKALKGADVKSAGTSAGRSFAAAFAKAVASGQGGAAAGAGKGLIGGAGPGILGLSAKRASIVAAGAAVAGAIPALTAIGGAIGLVGIAAKTLIGTKKNPGQLFAPAQRLAADLHKTITQAVQPLAGPLAAAFKQIPTFLKAIEPTLKAAFAAVGPLIGPMLHGVEALVKGVLPGLVSIMRAAGPAIAVLASIMGDLGKSVGSMLKSFAPAIRASSVILKALGLALNDLFPIVGKLAGIFARSLAPVLITFAKVIRAIEPVLVVIGKVIASLAQAVLGSLVGAFTAVATLIKDIAPSLGILARMLGSVFKTMENSGVFTILAGALEKVAPPLAKLINALVKNLAPFLPPILKLIGDLGGVIIGVLVSAITQLVPVAITLLNDIFKPLLPVVVSLVPVITTLAKLFGAGLITAITGLLKVAAPILVFVVKLVAGLIKWLSHTHLLIPLLVLLAAYLAPIPTAIALIAAAIGFLATHWKTIWGAIKQVAQDFGRWIWTDFGAKIMHFFTQTLPTAFDIFKNAVAITWDGIKLIFLKGVFAITGIMAKLPGPLGAPFKKAHEDIGRTLAAVEADVRKHVANIQADWGKLHGKTVGLIFKLGLPAGVSFPSRPIKGHKAKGGVASAGYWVTGEEGPEIAYLPEGTHVIPAGPTRKILGGLAGGTWGVTDAFVPAVGSYLASLNRMVGNAEDAIIRQVARNVVFSGGFGGGTGGAGVTRWAPVILAALGLLGQSPSWLGLVERRMNQESGGNPTVVNKWDSNWLAGHPSVGLMQVIQGTFDAYAGPFRNTGPFEYGVSVAPLANIYAGLNYAVHRYGSLAALGQPGGYKHGGWLTEAIAGVGMDTGRGYMFHGGEAVTSESGLADLAGAIWGAAGMVADAVHRNAGDTAAGVAAAISGPARRASFRAEYSPR